VVGVTGGTGWTEWEEPSEEDKALGDEGSLVLGPRLLAAVRLATREEYEAWLSGYVRQGGAPTHIYKYEFARAGFLIAAASFELDRPLYGGSAVHIIVPEGLNAAVLRDIGHNKVYEMQVPTR
jgi:hypothetical protein